MSVPKRGLIERLLVVLPNWVGDVVLASPVLAALRAHFRSATIAYLLRRYVQEIVEGGGWHDELVFWPPGAGARRTWQMLPLAAELRRRRFDAALLLTNSFRSAFVTCLARIPCRIGYARDGRGWLLTDRLEPLRRNGVFVPSPVLPYYVRLAEHLGCAISDRRVRLGITPAQEEAGQELLRHYGLADGQPYAVINPGAAYGAAKCWLPERFAELCDRLPAEFGLQPVIVGNPRTEGALMQRIAALARTHVVCCDRPPTTLGSLKVLIRQARLLVCNDTGPRHYGHAFSVPTVTIFGPTHQAWTDTDYAGEIKLQVPVECGPCQLKVCPLDHRCMTGLTTERVLRAVSEVLARGASDRGARPPACRSNVRSANTVGTPAP
jgi:heptosyltransferase-2